MGTNTKNTHIEYISNRPHTINMDKLKDMAGKMTGKSGGESGGSSSGGEGKQEQYVDKGVDMATDKAGYGDKYDVRCSLSSSEIELMMLTSGLCIGQDLRRYQQGYRQVPRRSAAEVRVGRV